MVVGNGIAADGKQQAFRWTQSGGMVGLGYLPGATTSSATAVSADGLVVVGYGDYVPAVVKYGNNNSNIGGEQEAWRWTQ